MLAIDFQEIASNSSNSGGFLFMLGQFFKKSQMDIEFFLDIEFYQMIVEHLFRLRKPINYFLM